MNDQDFINNGFAISDDKSKLQLETVCGFMERSHWAAHRPKQIIVKSIEQSLCYGIYHLDRQVGFARVVTDHCTFAYLCDVFVDEEYRGRGLSKWLMSWVMKNPDFSQLRRFILATKDAHGLYQKFGFKPFSNEEQRRFMSILKDNV